MKKNTESKKDIKWKKPIISDSVKSYANDPFFIKKKNAAKELLEKVGLPPEFIRKKD